MKEFVIKFNPDTHTKTGFLRTLSEKFYLGEDGILTIVPFGSSEGSFCGIIKGNTLSEVPDEFKDRTDRSINNLMRLHNAINKKLIN